MMMMCTNLTMTANRLHFRKNEDMKYMKRIILSGDQIAEIEI